MFAKAADMILSAKRCVAFTGAGISVESGIPPFRGENGLWNRYDPETFDISYFTAHPQKAWEIIRDIFYDLFGEVQPNAAHHALAEMESRGLLRAVITQNVDNLHGDAGNKIVYEFHGSLRKLICMACGRKVPLETVDLAILPPKCSRCGGLIKPDVVFFGEAIPEPAHSRSFFEAQKADLFILIGTTGEVAPANMIPRMAKQEGAGIIEINVSPSDYTRSITDIFLKGKATRMMETLMEEIDR